VVQIFTDQTLFLLAALKLQDRTMTVEFAGVNASDWILTETGQWTGKWETGQWWAGFSRYMLSNTDLKAIEANIAQHCMFQQHDEITNYTTLVILSGTASSMQNLRILQSNHFFIGPKIWSLQFLLHPRERLRSIVISTPVCVCLSVCLQGYLQNHMRDTYRFLWILLMAMAQSSSGRVMKSQAK